MGGRFDPMRIPMTLLTSRARPPRPGTRLAALQNRLTDLNVALYRRSGGRVSGHLADARLLLLHHVGRRTGTERVHPLVHIEDGDDLVLVASQGGAPKHPAWYLNLRANPDAVVEVGRERRRVRARDAAPEEAARLWPRLDAAYPPFAAYRTRTEREIPIVILERR